MMDNLKKSLNDFIKHENQPAMMIFNMIIFGMSFFDNLKSEGFLGAFFGAVIWTLLIALSGYYIFRPLIKKLFGSLPS